MSPIIVRGVPATGGMLQQHAARYSYRPGQWNFKFLYCSILFFLAGLIELEKENKFDYVVVAQLLPVHAQLSPPRRGSRALSVVPNMRGSCTTRHVHML